MIADVLADEHGITIADRLASRVIRFDSQAQFVQILGREGQGPGEFSQPVSLAPGPDGEVLVLDASLRRITRFGRSNGDSLELLSTTQLSTEGAFPQDICTLGTATYLLVLTEGSLIHRLSEEGTVDYSFGTLPAPSVRLGERAEASYRRAQVRGKLACAEELDLVLFMANVFPTISAYGPAGEHRWTVELEHYRETQFGETAEGRLSMSGDPETGTSYQLEHLTVLRDTLVLLQFVELREGRDSRESPVESQLLNLKTREVSVVEERLPRIGATYDSLTIGWVQVPYPQVRAYAPGVQGGSGDG